MKPLNFLILYNKNQTIMNKYFIEILRNRTLLTIPKFGALTVANRKTGKVVFNPNLTFDDNVLSDYIADNDGVDKVEAKNTIAKFVREIEAILDKGETYDIFQFGKFYKNDKGEVVFESTIDNLEKTETSSSTNENKVETLKENSEVTDSTKENVYIPPVEEKVEEVKEEIKEKLDSSLDDIKNKFKKTEKKVVEEVKDTKDEVKIAAASSINDIKNKFKKTEKKVVDEVKETKDEVKATVSTSADDVKNKFKKSNKKAVKPKKEKKIKEKGEKKKRRVLPLILLLLLLGGIGVGGYFYQDKIKELIGMSKTADHTEDGSENEQTSENVEGIETSSSENEETSLDETTSEENVAEENIEDDTHEVATEETENVVEEVVEEEVQPEPEPAVNSSVNGSYHVIGGAFGVESNATNFADKTGGKVLGKFNGLFQVAIKSFDSRADASSGLKQLSSEYPSAWILKYPK